jgi:Protein of unknown function (DUF1569)
MKNLFESAEAAELKERLAGLTPESPRLWGKMSPAQAAAHCAMAFDMASGTLKPARARLVSRMVGRIIKPMVLGNDAPLRRNSPTIKELLLIDQHNIGTERERLRGAIDRFQMAGPAGCTTHPHVFFGRLTPEQWAILMYKHVDHHLRQFGV